MKFCSVYYYNMYLYGLTLENVTASVMIRY